LSFPWDHQLAVQFLKPHGMRLGEIGGAGMVRLFTSHADEEDARLSDVVLTDSQQKYQCLSHCI
jgi:hypothetical protein